MSENIVIRPDRKIGRENHVTSDGRIISPGGLRWTPDPLPVYANPDASDEGRFPELVGYLTGVRRRLDDWIVGRLALFADKAGQIDLPLAMDLADSEVQITGEATPDGEVERLLIVKARVMACHLTTAPCWEGMTDA